MQCVPSAPCPLHLPCQVYFLPADLLTADPAGDVTVTVGGRACPLTETPISQFTVNSTNVTSINCYAPALPWGDWPVAVMVAGIGLARPPLTAARSLPFIAYKVLGSALAMVAPPVGGNATSPDRCRVGMFGGGLLTISGVGLVQGIASAEFGRRMEPAWDVTSGSFCGTMAGSPAPACTLYGKQSPVVAAATNGSQLSVAFESASGPTATVRFGRYTVSDYEKYVGNNTVRTQIRLRVRVYNTTAVPPVSTLNDAAGNAHYVDFCSGRTPFIYSLAPASGAVAPVTTDTPTLSLSFALLAAGTDNGVLTQLSDGAASNATVELESGSGVYRCTSPIVASSAAGATTYNESLTCTLPAYLPAANYTLWVCLDPFGCGYRLNYHVPVAVSKLAAGDITVSGPAGGLVVTILGSGFDTSAAGVRARFGSAPCTILAPNTNTSAVVCLVGALLPMPTSSTRVPLYLTPSAGATEAVYANITFTFNPALTATVTSISPARGGTAGGTNVTVTGTGFLQPANPSDLAVTVGSKPCVNVTWIAAASLTCVTIAPAVGEIRSPQPVRVWQVSRGYASSSVNYSYVDVWSRASTWGGGPGPKEGDSIVIEAGHTILLDVSPPPLNLIIVQGNLIFDYTQPYLNLQAQKIFVFGGALVVAGPAAAAYPVGSRANITLLGPPTSLELPIYGTKCIGLRDGLVQLYGQPKLPLYTVLNATADVGKTSITVVGQLTSWQVGACWRGD